MLPEVIRFNQHLTGNYFNNEKNNCIRIGYRSYRDGLTGAGNLRP